MTDLTRFRTAQDAIWPAPLEEIRAGAKRTHWMWFVLPQLRGLGHSAMAERYGLDGLAEARAYRADPVLGDRLAQMAAALMQHRDRRAETILGGIDALKLRSCATLFQAAGEPSFGEVLAAFFDGPDPETLRRLQGERDRG
ncbi:DUF1810 domain-containing protein [Falsirhodobacter halotolerans]|uniref:DUF1810 domain-containing protein n=1 Tax=Falsirhodobacter halotolerans TaxID=1146892 RepID=UPI001FD60469|nr:DUF1810 domain-containing protein [Falsirhodobacter halotolerans]MCJ8140777.1 DUF1810 domain-containing protein [Falsirhodobacter halotolerans]